VQEIDRDHKAVWQVTPADLPDFKLPNLQLAWRLPNGNTLFNTWVNEWSGPIDRATAPPQVLEVTPDKKVVWTYEREQKGGIHEFQILDTNGVPLEGVPMK